MHSRLLAAAFLFLALGCAAPVFAQAASKATIEKALIANENKINEAVAKHDLKTFNDLVAADAVSADMGGFMRVADFTKTFDQMKVSTWHIMNPQVVWIDDKSAIVGYTWMGKGTYMNQPIPETVYASTVWTERNGKWVAVFHQETAAAPPAPAKK
jgi:hypothetical protein